MSRLGVLASFLVLGSLVASPAWAVRAHARHDWVVGIGYGTGVGKFSDGAGVSIDARRGSTPQIRFGRSLGSRWLVHLNYEGWLTESGTTSEKQRRSLQNAAVTATFFPGDPERAIGGLYLRAGAGLGWGRAAAVELVDVDGVLTQTHSAATDEGGLGLVLGAGYEFQVTDHMAAGIGASVNHLSISKDRFDSGVYVPIVLSLNWYF